MKKKLFTFIAVFLVVGAVPADAQIIIGGSGHIMAQNAVASNIFIAKPLTNGFAASINYYTGDVFSADISWEYINVSKGFHLTNGQGAFYSVVLTPKIAQINDFVICAKIGVNCETSSIKSLSYKTTSTLFGLIVLTDLSNFIAQIK